MSVITAQDKDQILIHAIEQEKERWGSRLTFLAHHYQSADIVRLADFKGDSFELAKKASQAKDAEFIVFCGVMFMAQSAAVLAGDDQRVFLPDLSAGCPLADMAPLYAVKHAWSEVAELCGNERIIPVTYVNSDITLKAFTGAGAGSTCTSANSQKIFEWALTQGEKLFFFPDENLGRNTARSMGISHEKVITWDHRLPHGGNAPEVVRAAKVILWNGFCHVHTRFTTVHIEAARKRFPDATVMVHPECFEEVVQAADMAGSTGAIVRAVKDAPKGATIVIGTEINFVQRLAQEYPDKCIVELATSLCPNMYKIGLEDILFVLKNLSVSNCITVDTTIKQPARDALQRMIDIVG